MKASSNPIDQAFKTSADKLQVSISSDLRERFDKHSSKNRQLSLLKLSMRIAASVAIVIAASMLLLNDFSKADEIVDLTMTTTSAKYDIYKDYLKSDQYAQLKTSYAVLK